MKSAELRDRDDCATLPRFDLPRLRGILLQGKVRTRAVVVREVVAQDSPQMLLVEHDDVIEALSADGTDHAFHERALPWGASGDEDSMSPNSQPIVVGIVGVVPGLAERGFG